MTQENTRIATKKRLIEIYQEEYRKKKKRAWNIGNNIKKRSEKEMAAILYKKVYFFGRNIMQFYYVDTITCTLSCITNLYTITAIHLQNC